jgi:16S rRNA (guanine966-N2)-methyltransferase
MAYPLNMKIIAGERKGHSLTTPKGSDTRPTLGRVREALFSIIAGDIPGAVFYDLFAGAGAVGLEALSRGAEKAVLVESAREPFRCLSQNVEKLRYHDNAIAVFGDALRWPVPSHLPKPDIVFADPPYRRELIDRFVEKLVRAPINKDALIILQTMSSYTPKSTALNHLRTATYGNTALNFYLYSGPTEDEGNSETAAGQAPADE